MPLALQNHRRQWDVMQDAVAGANSLLDAGFVGEVLQVTFALFL